MTITLGQVDEWGKQDGCQSIQFSSNSLPDIDQRDGINLRHGKWT